MIPAMPGPMIVDVRFAIPCATFPAGSNESGKMLGMIAPDAGPPKASLTPIKTTMPPRIHIEIFSGLIKMTTLPIIARKPSERIKIVLRGIRSTQTPPTGARTTPDKTRAARIKPKVVALPPASRTVTASAIGNADMAILVKVAEMSMFRKAAYEKRAPGSKYFLNISEPTPLLLEN